MKISTIALIFLFIVSALPAASKKWIFHIKRNKNRNLVQYSIKLDDSCKPAGDEPVYGYWRMLEKGPRVTESIGWLEKKAYGIDDQKVHNGEVMVKLVALPERTITVKTSGTSGKCTATAYVDINKSSSVLNEVYVFAEEGMIKPTVKYIDINGKRSGRSVTEKIIKD